MRLTIRFAACDRLEALARTSKVRQIVNRLGSYTERFGVAVVAAEVDAPRLAEADRRRRVA